MALFFLFIAIFGCTLVHASVVQATLEPCTSSDSTDPSVQQNCSLRFGVTLSVRNGPNTSESTSTYTIASAVDAQGRIYDILDTLEITVSP